MASIDLKLLDCTLRDGGYINDWHWGFHKARSIINRLVRANVDFVEVGFLRNVDGYNRDVTVCNTIEELNKLLPENHGNTMFSAMAMRSNYDINKLTPYCGSGIEMIRITAHDYDIAEGMDFAREVKAKGYKLSINPINIMGYNDKEILWIIDQANDIKPYQFSIVDTFGSMKKRDLDRIVSLIDNNLNKDIRVAIHLHENMAQSFLLAQTFVDKHLTRPVAVDASLFGMGRIPGNLPIELIADYLNEYTDKFYDIDYIMDAIQDYIAPLKGETEWGYTPAYFLSAKYNLHRNYAEHYLNKGDLTNRDINHILSTFDRKKCTAFDTDYADKKYDEYKNVSVDDSETRKLLVEQMAGRPILILAPGMTLKTHRHEIEEYIFKNKPTVITVNFVPDDYKCDYAFFSNNKRFSTFEEYECQTIITSNLFEANGDFVIDYNSIFGTFEQGSNSLIMLLKLLNDLKFSTVAIAGADGYSVEQKNYYSSNLSSTEQRNNDYNIAVSNVLNNIGINVEFITPTKYN